MKRSLLFLVFIISAIVITGCAAPTFDPPSGNYPEDISVELSAKISSQQIYYTTDGSDPSTSSNQYAFPIQVSGNGTNMTIKAITVMFGIFKSKVASADYKIEYGVIQPPQFSPIAGQYDNPVDVTITSATGGSAIYYTLDGTDPTTSSSKYTSPIHISSNKRIRAFAVYKTWQSTIAEADYLIGCMDSSSSWGDPHFHTYDGLVYHDQSIGEFVLTQEKGGTGFAVHVREARISGFSPCVTLNTALAVRLDTNKVEYRASSNEILVDGVVVALAEGVTMTLSGGGTVRRQSGIVCSDSNSIETVIARDAGNYVNITVVVACSLQGKLEGLLGNDDDNASNELLLRNGTTAPTLKAFMDSWRLSNAESLFSYVIGQNTNYFTDFQTCDIHPTDDDIALAQKIYNEIFGSIACDAGMVYAIAVDLAAGMPEDEVKAWGRSIQGYVAPKGTLWYQDVDGDGYGTVEVSKVSCSKPSGYVDNSEDCDDTNPDVNPEADEIIGDGIDNNCNGLIDETNMLGPLPYLSFSDSPFRNLSFSYFYLEDFEDGILNTPGVSANNSNVGGMNPYADSVDRDDGVIDGNGNNGHSIYLSSDTSDTFTFDKNVLGKLPTYAGIVWTDAGSGYGNVTFTAFDEYGLSLGSISAMHLGDGSNRGGTAEDRFFGVIYMAGISKITIAMNSGNWEIDHLQYGAK